jgi:hypothetical protein
VLAAMLKNQLTISRLFRTWGVLDWVADGLLAQRIRQRHNATTNATSDKTTAILSTDLGRTKQFAACLSAPQRHATHIPVAHSPLPSLATIS